MLKSLDILIGLSVVMLIVSMAVTLMNQTILNALARRGRCLQEGIADLLQHLDWRMPRQTAEEIAAMVLTEPSVRKTKVGPVLGSLFPSLQFGEVIHREEFAKILLGFGPRATEIKEGLKNLETAIAGSNREEIHSAVSALICVVESINGVRSQALLEVVKTLEEIDATRTPQIQSAVFDKVAESLAAILDPLEKIVCSMKVNGITEPGKTLDNVRMMALQLEKVSPDQANDVRQANALLQEASSPFLAKINLAFDQTMDRVAQRYTYNARIVTFFSAAIVAVALQLDTVYIFNRLSLDDKMREALVTEAARVVADEEVKKLVEREASNKDGKASGAVVASAGGGVGSAGTPQAGTGGQPGHGESDDAKANAKANYYLHFLAQQGVIRLPASFSDWRDQWKKVNPAGIFLSMMLLSMGAPFWYRAIGKLLQFRSILAQKDDDQRVTRQTSQTPETSPKPGAPPASPVGERGNLMPAR